MCNPWLRFNAVGLLGFALQLSILGLLVHSFELPLPFATLLAVETALLHNFVWHEKWTWAVGGKSQHSGTFSRLLRFHAAGAVSIAGNVVLTTGLAQFTPVPVVIANALAATACALVNFFLARNFVFFEKL